MKEETADETAAGSHSDCQRQKKIVMVDVGAVKISVPFIILQRILNSYGYKLGQLKSGFSNRFIYSTIIRMLGNEAGVGFLLSAYQARNQMAGENIVESMKQLREYLIELGIDPDQGIPPASPSAPNQSTPGTPGASSGLAASSQAQKSYHHLRKILPNWSWIYYCNTIQNTACCMQPLRNAWYPK
jgi:hypothetical protein